METYRKLGWERYEEIAKDEDTKLGQCIREINEELQEENKPTPEDEHDMETWIEQDLGEENLKKLEEAFVQAYDPTFKN